MTTLDQALVAELLGWLKMRGETLGVAESLTGGRLAAHISSVPGASSVFVGGVVSYATEVKMSVLGVPPTLVAEEGVISAGCAGAMATGLRALLGCSWAVSTTGVAGPDRQEDQAVGTVFVAIAGVDGMDVHRLTLSGDRASIQEQTCERALQQLANRVA